MLRIRRLCSVSTTHNYDYVIESVVILDQSAAENEIFTQKGITSYKTWHNNIVYFEKFIRSAL